MAGEAGDLLECVRPPQGPAAVAVIDESGAVDIAAGPEADGLFEVGSLTKPMVALLLADLVVDGVVGLDTTVGSLLGARAGGAEAVTLAELATHTSGLPRLPRNAMKPPFWPRDPYRFYGERRLFDGLAGIGLDGRGTVSYSNLGFALLGLCVATAGQAPLNRLLSERVFEPLGMSSARCQPCSAAGLVPARAGMVALGGRRWHVRLPGAGGVDATIADLAAFARANLRPDDTPLAAAIRLTHDRHVEVGDDVFGLAWKHTPDGLGHEGATGRFQSAVAITPGRRAVAALVGMGPQPGAGYALGPPLGEWLRGRAEGQAATA